MIKKNVIFRYGVEKKECKMQAISLRKAFEYRFSGFDLSKGMKRDLR